MNIKEQIVELLKDHVKEKKRSEMGAYLRITNHRYIIDYNLFFQLLFFS